MKRLFYICAAIGIVAILSLVAFSARAATTVLPVFGGGTGTSTFTQGWIYSTGGTNALAASTSPTVNYITATSTTATSTFAAGINFTAFNLTATSTGSKGINLTGGCFAIGANCLSLSNLTGTVAASQGGTGIDSSALSGIAVINSGVWSASSTLAVNRGGTGAATLTAGDLVLGNGTGAFTSTSTLAVNKGGTGAATLTGCLTGNGTGAITGSGTCNTSNATVSSITAGTGLSGGTITTSGTIALVWPWTISSTYGTTTANATSSVPWYKLGLTASSTSYLVYASSTALTATTLCLTGDTCRTTWPTGGSGVWPFTPSSFSGVANQSTTTPFYLKGTQIIASSTNFDTASTTLLSSSNTAWLHDLTLTTSLTVANGGTATSTMYAGGILYYDGTLGTVSQSGDGNGLFFDRTNKRLGLASSTPWSMFSLGSGGAISITEASTTFASTVNIDFSTKQTTKVEMTGAITVNLKDGAVPGLTRKVILCQDGVGSRTVAWAASSTLIWAGHTAPTQTSTANECDIYSFITTGATGTVQVFGVATQAF